MRFSLTLTFNPVDENIELTKLTDVQSEYLGIPIDGPYKPDAYRY